MEDKKILLVNSKFNFGNKALYRYTRIECRNINRYCFFIQYKFYKKLKFYLNLDVIYSCYSDIYVYICTNSTDIISVYLK